MVQNANILLNSLPKSGTHLLEKALILLGGQTAERGRGLIRRATDRCGLTPPPFLDRRSAGRWNNLRLRGIVDSQHAKTSVPIGVFAPTNIPRETFAKWVQNRPLSGFVKGHVPYSHEAAAVLNETATKTIVIVRDPRAVAASMLLYVMHSQNWTHFLRPFFEQLNADERLDFLMNGGHADPPGYTFLPLRDAFASVLAWQQDRQTLVIRFEDLVGPLGGGSPTAQMACFEALSAHLDVTLSDETVNRVHEAFDPASPTFRTGRSDSWRQDLNVDQITRIEAALDPGVLAKAGYVSAEI